MRVTLPTVGRGEGGMEAPVNAPRLGVGLGVGVGAGAGFGLALALVFGFGFGSSSGSGLGQLRSTPRRAQSQATSPWRRHALHGLGDGLVRERGVLRLLSLLNLTYLLTYLLT